MTREPGAVNTLEGRSLDLCAVGLGQCGGNLAAEWRRRGYRAIVLNTARADMRGLARTQGLDVPQGQQVYIGVQGADGAGKDPTFGRACVREHAGIIRAAVQAHLEGADALLLCAGLGGGTGSAVDELVRVLEPLGIPLLVCATLPGDSESGIAKVNAVQGINAVVTQKLDGRVFIDNNRLVEAFPGLDLLTYYPKVNAKVLSPLDELNRLNAREDLWSIRTFDGEDLRKLLLSGGILQTYVVRLKDGPLQAPDLLEVVARCVDGGDYLARGLTLPNVAYLAVVIVGPEKALKATSMQAFDDMAREIKKQTGGGAVYEGLYVAGDDTPLRAFILSASLALPQRITTLLGAAQTEGKDLARKILAEIPGLEVSPLEGLSLFRAPTRRARPSDRVASARPRAVADQVKEELDNLSTPPMAVAQPPASAAAVVTFKGPKPAPAPVSQPPSAEVELPSLLSQDAPPARPAAAPRRADPANVPRVGTGQWDGDEEKLKKMEPTAMVADQLRKAPAAQTPIADDDSDEELDVTNPSPSGGTGRPGGKPSDPTWLGADDIGQVSLGGQSVGGELQAVYEDLIDRFKQAPDRRGRERVARRLIDDSRATDVEVRALAVWAMVKVGEPGFRRALAKAANDDNPEISKLALTGLERLGGANEPGSQ